MPHDQFEGAAIGGASGATRRNRRDTGKSNGLADNRDTGHISAHQRPSVIGGKQTAEPDVKATDLPDITPQTGIVR